MVPDGTLEFVAGAEVVGVLFNQGMDAHAVKRMLKVAPRK